MRRSRRITSLAAVATAAAVVVAVVLTVGDVGAPVDGSPAADGPVADTASAGCSVDTDPPVMVGEIGAAIAAVESLLGTDVEYFEINAAAGAVNLFVAGTALDGSGQVTPYAFIDGELQAESPRPAEGARFVGGDVDIETDRVLSCVTGELPGSTVTAFVVLGVEAGGVRYAVLVDSSVGGQLFVEVSRDGRVLSVETIDPG